VIRSLSRPQRTLWLAGLASLLGAPVPRLAAQALDSTGMPSLERLAEEAGRASRQHPIRAVVPALLCEPTHPLVDSASLAARAALDHVRATAITAAFAYGLGVPLTASASDTAAELPVCPADLERGTGARVLTARITAPLAGVRDGQWEGRITLEFRCRSEAAGRAGGIRTMGKEFLYQWSGRAWQLYQHSWWRAER
jgi:hypothetical protein